MRKYGAQISAIKEDKAHTKVWFLESDSPLTVLRKFEQACKEQYPESEGWRSHSTSQPDAIVIY